MSKNTDWIFREKNPFDWIGREIEYRDHLPLSDSNRVYRGRISAVYRCGYAHVRATYVSNLTVYSRSISKALKYLGTEKYDRCKHHNTIYYVRGKYHFWKPIEEELIHTVKWSRGKSKWKAVEPQNFGEHYHLDPASMEFKLGYSV